MSERITPQEAITRDTDRLRHALRGLSLDERDERYLTHYARIWDYETLDVVIGWIEQAREQRGVR